MGAQALNETKLQTGSFIKKKGKAWGSVKESMEHPSVYQHKSRHYWFV